MLGNANIEVVQAIHIRVPGEPGNEAIRLEVRFTVLGFLFRSVLTLGTALGVLRPRVAEKRWQNTT